MELFRETGLQENKADRIPTFSSAPGWAGLALPIETPRDPREAVKDFLATTIMEWGLDPYGPGVETLTKIIFKRERLPKGLVRYVEEQIRDILSLI
jgi:hypothetical protein